MRVNMYKYSRVPYAIIDKDSIGDKKNLRKVSFSVILDIGTMMSNEW